MCRATLRDYREAPREVAGLAAPLAAGGGFDRGACGRGSGDGRGDRPGAGARAGASANSAPELDPLSPALSWRAMPPRRRTLLAGIVVLGAVLRFATLDGQSYWFDEATTVRLLRMDLGDMLGAIPDSESTPPLYYAIAWFWAKLFGTGEVGLRSLSALVGTLTIPVVYAVGARWAGSRAGTAAAALAATSPLLVWYSQEARAYALLVLLAALTLMVLPRALERPAGGRLAAWAAIAGLAIATHYFAAFLVVPEAVWLLHRRRARAVIPVAAVGVVSLALLPMAVQQAENDGARYIRATSEVSRLASIPKQFLVGYDAPGELAAAVFAALLALYGAYLLLRRADAGERRSLLPLGLLAALVVAVPALLTLGGVDYLITRNVIVALVPSLVLLATGFAARSAGRGGIAAATALAALGAALCVGVAIDDRYQRDDWRGVAERLGPASGPRLLVVSPVNGRIPLEVYLRGARKARPNEHRKVGEINVVGFAPRGPGDPADAPRPPNPPTPPGFRLVRRVETDTYTLVTYRTDNPFGFPDPPLYGLALGAKPADLVIQDPGR